MPRRVPVRCVQTGEVFESIREAAEVVGIQAGSIYSAMRLGHRIHGLHWEPVRQDDGDRYAQPGIKHKGRPVKRQDGTVFESVRAAAKACGLSRESIYGAISRRRRTGTPQRAGGWGWDYIENSEHV